MSICPMVSPKNALQKIYKLFRKKYFYWVALAAVQVQGGLGHGEIEEGEKKKTEKSLAELLLGHTNGFFVGQQQEQ